MALLRYPINLNLTLVSTEADTEAIPFGDSAAGVISIPAGATAASLTFYVSDAKDGTYVQLYDSSNNAVTRTVAAERAYALPDECFAARWLKIVPDVNTTATLTLKG
jgi:hypothetical protein